MSCAAGTDGVKPLHNPEAIAVVPRARLESPQLQRWDFDEPGGAWKALHAVRCRERDGLLAIEMLDADPYVAADGLDLEGALLVRLRLRSSGVGPGQIYWTTESAQHTSEERVVHFPLRHDGSFHEYEVVLPVEGRMTLLRFDPGTGKGTMEIDWISLRQERLHPLELIPLEVVAGGLRAVVVNRGDEGLEVIHGGERFRLEAGEQRVIESAAPGRMRFETVSIAVKVVGAEFPPVEFRASVMNSGLPLGPYLELGSGTAMLRVAKDGSGGEILLGDRIAGWLQPLLSEGYQPVLLTGGEEGEGRLRFASEAGHALSIHALGDGRWSFEIDAPEDVDGPVFRLADDLEQALFPGVEYLGSGEHSSSRTDIRTAEHVRHTPPRRWVTMPLMVLNGGAVSAEWTWDNLGLQPVFAVPDFLGARREPRMHLAGGKGLLRLRIGPGWDTGERIETIMERFVRERGLPAPPAAPRSPEAQRALSLQALRGALRSEQGWGHCADEGWDRRFFAGHASTEWLLTGEIPQTPELVPGGIHIENDLVWLLTGRAEAWLGHLRRRARQVRGAQEGDGSFRYDGRFREGHFENTSSGHCAANAWVLLDHAWWTGDEASLAAGLRALEFMRRFRTPRGAQVWEVPLHTPDILAAAAAVRAYLRGYGLTGEREWLEEARRWAWRGLPFVYLWDDRPVMRYATIAVLGATHWQAPNWMGLPVQWCGLSYAFGLSELADVDDSFDWRRVAEGILTAAEQMQYPEGATAGCLPDSFELGSQERRPFDVNPCVMAALRERLSGRTAGLQIAVREDGRRAVSPFPLRWTREGLEIDGHAGVGFQVVIDGERIVELRSAGKDILAVE